MCWKCERSCLDGKDGNLKPLLLAATLAVNKF